MSILRWLKSFAEYLGGAADAPPPGLPAGGALAWGLWWGILLALIAAFCGQASKFIYIDF